MTLASRLINARRKLMPAEGLVFSRERTCRLSTLETWTCGVVIWVDPHRGDAVDRLLGFGITPGANVKVLQTYPTFKLLCDEAELSIDPALADAIFVKPEDDW
jgi:Fe2+ transport system protein FeoA